MADVLAAYDLLVSQPGVDPQSIAVVGSSYGGYLSVILTSMRPVRWLGLRVPALYKDAEWEVPKRQLDRAALVEYRSRPVPPDSNRALRACATFKGDVLIVASEHDHLVPRQTMTSYRAACGNAQSMTFRIIDGADHALSDKADRRAYTTILGNWISEMVLGARSN